MFYPGASHDVLRIFGVVRMVDAVVLLILDEKMQGGIAKSTLFGVSKIRPDSSVPLVHCSFRA